VDAVFQNLGNVSIQKKVLGKKYILLTLHRPSNVDNKKTFSEIIRGIEMVSKKLDLPVYFPLHPRTKIQLKKHRMHLGKHFVTDEPRGYISMLNLEKNASLILTDSGGVQEEACIMKVPCVTIRDNTERPETLAVGSNLLAGTNPNKILSSSLKMIKTKRMWKNPFGDGKSASRIVSIVLSSGFK
jgi:UDP-N-acetylglucosamine 2-epimerase (non-hydrolysing)